MYYMKILPVLKFVYRGLLTGLPMLTYNPITKLNFQSPFNVRPLSTYINYQLDSNQYNYLNQYLKNKNSSLIPEKVTIDDNNKEYYLSINIYNCSVPIIPSDNDVTRCEINTYVRDTKEGIGTLIIDYTSNAISMDPVNIFKGKEDIEFIMKENILSGYCSNKNIDLDMNFIIDTNDKDFYISDHLVDYSDKIFYSNSIFDKLYYDTSLIRAKVKTPNIVNNIKFRFGELNFEKPSSIFYFQDNINFAGSIWHNVYTIDNN